ncbi:hypothetical protein FB567DRAFT_344812 [Paraphoma chrysanthemicola]|uniref:Myb-like domain-containing protein n=1 Tax=Paraphoma chrysanthemicola TaxID=798071 RepID=A0A8K0R658_9PLEO|nr:hypothetical protein FB567DRAFT_344812 [Paraphoma chrysanthemicola]
MSAEEGAAQPPTAGSDKTQAPKPAATFSSFINKNTTGKKFAPKAARRRPGAAPAPAAVASKPAATEPTAPSDEVQSERVAPASSTAATAAQLPTPAATQDQVPQNAIATPAGTASDEPSVIVEESSPTVALPTLSTAVTNTESLPQVEARVEEATHILPAQHTANEADTGRAAKRQRIDPPAQTDNAVNDLLPEVSNSELHTEATVATRLEPDTATQPIDVEVQPSTEVQQALPTTEALEQAEEGHDSTQGADSAAAQIASNETPAPQPRKRRVLPWVAVNRHPDEDEAEETIDAGETEDVAPAPAKKKRQPPRPRGRKKTGTVADDQDAGQQDDAAGGEDQPTQKRPGAKSRGKRRADATNVEDGVEPPAIAKRTRRPRKAKDKDSATAAGEDVEDGVEEGGELVVPRKPRQPRRKKKTAVEGEGEQNGEQPKRKGRPPREATPSDAEDHEIDPEETFMDSLASRNIRVGRLSDREKAMREIDWVAVRQRQREEDTRPIQTKQLQEEADKLLETAEPIIEQGPQYRLIDGQIHIIPTSTFVDREGDADREMQNYEVVEERDLTSRITSRSFLKKNRRFPNEFLLPGQGKKWTADDTQLFYQGLRNFGTDFQMISHMFPGSTRRSIKLKFTREERENPDTIRECLHGQSEIVGNWDSFMATSQMEEEQLEKVDTIKLEMDAYEAEMREKIAAATAETLERKRQQREAGLLDDEAEGNDASNKENGKGKRKNKGKQKQVTFQDEPGVEIVGNIDDDHTWGQE